MTNKHLLSPLFSSVLSLLTNASSQKRGVCPSLEARKPQPDCYSNAFKMVSNSREENKGMAQLFGYFFYLF